MSCKDCDLCCERTNAVPGEGSPHARIMFVGEGPGFNEDKQGRPFIGASGNFLTNLLGSIGLRREDVFITNMVKCRPPKNRDPLSEEMDACRHYLDEQIAEIMPKIIVPLGRHALARWFPGESIGKLRAQPKMFGAFTLFPLYHPAAALHNGRLRSTIEEDFTKLGALLASFGSHELQIVEPDKVGSAPLLAVEPDPEIPVTLESALESEPQTGRDKADNPPPEQLSMF